MVTILEINVKIKSTKMANNYIHNAFKHALGCSSFAYRLLHTIVSFQFQNALFSLVIALDKCEEKLQQQQQKN